MAKLGGGANRAKVSKLSTQAQLESGYKDSEAAILGIDRRQKIVEDSPFRPERVLGEIKEATSLEDLDDGWYIDVRPGVDLNKLVQIESSIVRDRYDPKKGDAISIAGDFKYFTDIGNKWQDLFTPVPPDDFYQILDVLAVRSSLPDEANPGDKILLIKDEADDSIALFENSNWTEQTLLPGDTYLIEEGLGSYSNYVAVVVRDRNSTQGKSKLNFISPEKAGVIFLGTAGSFYTWNTEKFTWETIVLSLKKATENKTFYVSASGDNNNPGTFDRPFLNFTRASLAVTSTWDFVDTYDCEILAKDNLTAFGNFNRIFTPRGIRSSSGIKIGSVDSNNPVSITFRNSQGFTLNQNVVQFKDLIIIGTRNDLSAVTTFDATANLDNIILKNRFGFALYAQGNSTIRIENITVDNLIAESLSFSDGSSLLSYRQTLSATGTSNFSTAIFLGEKRSSTFLREGFGYNNAEGSISGSTFELRDSAQFNTTIDTATGIRLINGTTGGKLYGSSTAFGLPFKPFSNLIIGTAIEIGTNDNEINVPELYYEILTTSDRVNVYAERIYQSEQTILLSDKLAVDELDFEGIKYIIATPTGIELTNEFPKSSSSSNTALSDRSDRFYLGAINIVNGAIAQIFPFLVENNPNNYSSNLLFVGGIVNRSFVPFPKPGTRSFSLPAGNLEVVGANYFTESTFGLHSKAIAFTDVVQYDLYTPIGELITASEIELDFSRIWDGEQIQSVSGRNASVVYFYYSPYRRGNKVVGVIGTINYGSFNTARNNWKEMERYYPLDWLEQPSKLICAVIGRVDYANADQIARVNFVPNLDFQGLP